MPVAHPRPESETPGPGAAVAGLANLTKKQNKKSKQVALNTHAHARSNSQHRQRDDKIALCLRFMSLLSHSLSHVISSHVLDSTLMICVRGPQCPSDLVGTSSFFWVWGSACRATVHDKIMHSSHSYLACHMQHLMLPVDPNPLDPPPSTSAATTPMRREQRENPTHPAAVWGAAQGGGRA